MSALALEDLFFEDVDASVAAQVTQRSLIDTQERLGMMLDVMPMGLIIHTRQGILFANQEACRLMQLSKAGAVGHHFLDFIPPGDFPAVDEQLSTSFAPGAGMQERETKFSRADRSVLDIKLISCPLPWDGNPVIQILLQDITAIKQSELTLRRLSITDELTGAFNRRHAFYEASLYMDRTSPKSVPLSLVLADIDHFKNVNDTYGHHAGDLALIALAKLGNSLLASLTDCGSGMFSRIGGEEFLIVLPTYSVDQAMGFAEKLRRAVERIRIPTEGKEFGFTISMGVAEFEDCDPGMDELLSRCDKALYEAKHQGRNRVLKG